MTNIATNGVRPEQGARKPAAAVHHAGPSLHPERVSLPGHVPTLPGGDPAAGAAGEGGEGAGPGPYCGVDELDLLIRARYPVIYTVSWEEERVQRHLELIAARRGKSLYTWSVTTGMQRVGNASKGASASVCDPVDALSAVIEHKEPAIYLFKDLNAFLKPGCPACRPAIRRLREVARALTDSYKTLVIVSPLMELAPDLEKDVTVLDFPLPRGEHVDALLSKICDDVKDNPAFEVNLSARGRAALVQAAGGLTLQEAENVFAKTLVNDGRLTGEDVSTVFAEKQQIVRKSGLLEYYPADEDLDKVGGMAELKGWIRKRSAAFTDEARAFGLPAPKGMLLVGVQGCGKSLCAKAVSREWNMPLLRFDVGRMFSSLVGSSEENIRRAIRVAESIAPVVLWVDEIDKAMAGSQGSARTDGGTTARVMSTFLTWLSEKQSQVFVVATANDITQLPPELLRKGRLDEIFFVDLPSAAERRRILEIHLSRRKRDVGKFDLDVLATGAEGFSGAEIEQAVISAMYDVFELGRDLTTGDILKACSETVPLSRTMSERINGLRAWAEGRARPAALPESPLAAESPSRRRLEA
ncbi:MAG: AAA family ATPase [Phycisphaerales bacterium]